jgi:hypothetical protein
LAGRVFLDAVRVLTSSALDLAPFHHTVLQESFHPLFNLGSDIGPALRHFQLIEAQVPWFWEATVFIIGTCCNVLLLLCHLSVPHKQVFNKLYVRDCCAACYCAHL